jgi:hypothetical protein
MQSQVLFPLHEELPFAIARKSSYQFFIGTVTMLRLVPCPPSSID